MKLTVTGSSSQGNGYILHNESEALMIEAGTPMKETLAAVGFDASKIRGCIVSHEHGDHAGRVAEVLGYAIPVFASRGTVEEIGPKVRVPFRPTAIGRDEATGAYATLQMGGFTVIPFPTQHDAREPLGFLIWHQETGAVLFATDTYYIRPRFAGLNNILIECNYSEEALARNVERGTVDPARAERTRAAHLSYQTCLGALKANDLSAVNNIVLIHLSNDNADAGSFASGIAAATRRRVTTARPGLTIPFDKTPF